jgi:hypothetical protein
MKKEGNKMIYWKCVRELNTLEVENTTNHTRKNQSEKSLIIVQQIFNINSLRNSQHFNVFRYLLTYI